MGTHNLVVDAPDPEATRATGERLARILRPGDVVALYGELGAGKTCFIQGLARGMGVRSEVTSPTFIFVNEYQGRLPIYHVDLYRTEDLQEIVDLGIEEYLYGDGITVVEWAEKIEHLLPAGTIRVTISGLGDEPRKIRLEGVPEGWDGQGGVIEADL